MKMLNVGDKIEIIEMNGEPQYTGRRGIVTRISRDPWGDIAVYGTWGGCAVYPDVDAYEIIGKTVKKMKTVYNDFTKENIRMTIWQRLERYSIFTTFEVVDIFEDLTSRVFADIGDETTEDDIPELLNNAIDNGLIYSNQQWTMYRYFCDMGDPVERMWDGVYNMLSSIVYSYIG